MNNEEFETIATDEKPVEKIETPEVETVEPKAVSKKDYTEIIVLIILVVLAAGIMIYMNYKKKTEDGNTTE